MDSACVDMATGRLVRLQYRLRCKWLPGYKTRFVLAHDLSMTVAFALSGSTGRCFKKGWTTNAHLPSECSAS